MLAAVFVLSLLIGFTPGASVIWLLSAVFGAALAAYVVLLVQLRRRAEERERKLRYLSARSDRWDDASGALDATAGRYGHPSYGAVAVR